MLLQKAEAVQLPLEIQDLLNHGRSYEFVGVAKSGASGPKVLFYSCEGKLYALKYGHTRVPISTQLSNRDKLAPYLDIRLPKVHSHCCYEGGEAMLMDAATGPTLHQAIMEHRLSNSEVTSVTESILEEVSGMWLNSAKPVQALTRDPLERNVRVVEAVMQTLADFGVGPDDDCVVNGRRLGKIQNLLYKLETYSNPKYSVICHSDLNGDNFVLENDLSPADGWKLIDWEWVGHHDWKLSLSHFVGWWYSNGTKLKSPATFCRVQGALELSYDLQLPVELEIVEKLTYSTAQRVSAEFGESWWNTYQQLLASLLLGDLRFLKQRNREAYLVACLGQGFEILARL